MAIDADPTGNTATHVETIDPCASLAGPGSTATIDIAVDQIPDEAISGIGITVLYDPAVVSVTALDFQYLMAAAGPMQTFDSSDGLPDTDGEFHIDVLAQPFPGDRRRRSRAPDVRGRWKRRHHPVPG